jgi:hypothetical protein
MLVARHRPDVETNPLGAMRIAEEKAVLALQLLVEQYAENGDPEKRYSPAVCIGCKKRAIIGDPDPAMISIQMKK